MLRLVGLPDDFDVVSQDVAEFSFGALDEDEISIAVSCGGRSPSVAEDLAGLPPSGVAGQSEFDAEFEFGSHACPGRCGHWIRVESSTLS